MGKVKFTLKNPNSNEGTLVYLIYNYQYKRFKYSTGEKINPKYWNKLNQRAKGSRQFPEHPEFNSRLDLMEAAFNNSFRRLLNDAIQPNNYLIKEAFEAELSGNILKPHKASFFEFIENFIQESKATKRLGTVKVYRTVFNHLKEFQKTKKIKIDYDSISIEFYNQYVGFLSNNQQLSTNTIGKHIKTFKTFMNEAAERGLHTNLAHKKRKFKSLNEEADTIYLSLEEIKKIEDTDLSESPRLDKVRDLFLIGCYTGLRFSDFTQIKPENIQMDKRILKFRTQKTGERVYIPIHPGVMKIFNKHKKKLPKAYQNQVMNRYLKELAEMAEINDMTETTITRAGILEKDQKPKFKLVTTHTARRSFATNAYLAGIPSIAIMKITGHKSEKSFLKYIRVTKEQNADILLNHPFFQ